MNKITFFAILLLGLPAAWAGDFASRMKEAYLATDKNFEIDCFYSYNKTWKLVTPVGLTRKTSETLSRVFEVDSGNRKTSLVFMLKQENGKLVYEALFGGVHRSSGRLRGRDFIPAAIADTNFSTEFELSRLRCAVNLADAKAYPLYDGDHHISVHPHDVYDWQKRLKIPVETYLNDPSFTSVILLEAGNLRGHKINLLDFFADKTPELPVPQYPTSLTNVPDSIPLIVSPAGNSRYLIRAWDEINVTYTGGNHNYCIWNSARHILEDLLNSRMNPRVNFRYDTAAIVAQPRGVERTGINFPKAATNRSNLLRDLLADTAVDAATYHKNYLYYFSNYLANEYVGMYRTYTVDYAAPGFKETRTFQGKGTRDIVVTFRYF